MREKFRSGVEDAERNRLDGVVVVLVFRRLWGIEEVLAVGFVLVGKLREDVVVTAELDDCAFRAWRIGRSSGVESESLECV